MKKITVLMIAAVVIILAAGCSQKESITKAVAETENTMKTETLDVFAMDTYMNIRYFTEENSDCTKKLQSEIEYLESIFSVTAPKSDISKINSNAGRFTAVSEDTAALVKRAAEISEMTEGSLDITVYPMLKEWGFTTGNYKIPEQTTLNDLLKNTGYHNIALEDNKIKIPENFAVDLGAVAKGYTGDKLCDIFRKENVKSALINLGGNVQTVGTKPDGSLWKVALKNPADTEKEVCVVSLSDKAMITSGGYERYFVGKDGKQYWHILDPKTGYPSDKGLLSVTVIGEDGTLCDALSTALFVMGEEKAKAFVKTQSKTDVILINRDMEIFITENLKDHIKMLDNFCYQIIA